MADPRTSTLAERFWQKVEKSDGCWTWRGARDRKGYGNFKRGTGQSKLSHRAAWEFTNGPVPGGLLVCHRCNNKSCVNPSHLYIATNATNLRDAYRDGLIFHAQKKKERCPFCGGDYSTNKYGRFCKPCKNKSNRRTKRARLARAAIAAARLTRADGTEK